ncbi:glucosaminidase domain-containing protein [Clostridium sp. D43t1_170807_H7]|uniref:glucosaminidase domain-containing protein n=1 Tax=Clostridium sp. D43t1_170807_H7 TaxID=2787140 RepID=UPI001898E2EB|nr:glucosaminidase domain-containing protein [Clostridium sp. D43t1_170807_H7]
MKKNKKLKSIISLILTILLIVPSVNAYATDSNKVIEENVEEILIDESNKDVIESDESINGQENISEEINIEDVKEDNDINEISVDGNEANNEDIAGELYEVIENHVPYTVKNSEFEREEFQLKYENLYDDLKLKKKTEEDYEIALAYSDGTYRFVDSTNSIEEAKNEVLEAESNLSDNSIVPVVLDENGQVTYSTLSMGRILKHINGEADPTFSNNTNIYTTSSLSNAFTYINHGYVDDVPVIEDLGNVAKIQVAGYTGWVNKDTSSMDYDLVIVPINQVTNPSYYMNKGGVLYHFISSNLRATTETGNTIRIGLAPTYLKEGVKYLSYDGNYFYDGSNISTGLTNLICDLRANTKNNSINKSNPCYNYFNYLPFRSRTSYTANELNDFINEKTISNSKLRDTGEYFINAQEKYGVNALLALGIAINESNWGKSTIAQNKNNIFGMNAVDSSPGQSANYYKSVELCINEFAKYYISGGYADPADWRYHGGFLGNKYRGANVKYASDPFWGEKATAHAFTIDMFLSKNDISNLKDYNAFTIIKYTGENRVINSNNTLLYNIYTDFSKRGGYIDTVAVITDNNEKNIGGNYYKEIYAERNTAVGSGGTANKYPGEYNWDSRGYIKGENIEFLNTGKSNILPIDPNYANKWKNDNGNYYYYNSSGVLCRGWKAIGMYWYYFDANTAIMQTGWIKYNGDWYYLEPTGKAKTGWLNDNGKWYYFDSNCKMLTGWQKISGEWYYLEASGQAKTGWLNDNGKWYYFDSNCKMLTGWQKISGEWYYLEASGQAKTGWLNDNGKWYYFDSNCKMLTGWQKISGEWYYLEASGQAKTGWLNDNGKWYYFDSSCKMKTGWIEDGGKKYYLYSNGAMAVNTIIDGIKIGSDGAAIK